MNGHSDSVMSDAARIAAFCVLSLLLAGAADTASAALGVSGEAPARLPVVTSPLATLELLPEPAADNPGADTPFAPPKPPSTPVPEPTVPGDLACSPDKP